MAGGATMKKTIWLCLGLLLAPAALADSWARPVVREVFSASRDYFVRIVPGESVGDAVGFASAPRGRHAQAELYRRAPDRSYRLAGEVVLANPVAPVEFFVADSGHFVTVDNWHNLGYGKVVAIYDAAGTPIRSYALDELFSAKEIEKFPHSVSSIHWRNGPLYVRQDQKTLYLMVRSGADFLFGLESGRYQYCEPQGQGTRCRNDVRPGTWKSWKEAEVTR
jgi:hypothetical protein